MKAHANIVRVIVLILALALIILGITRGEVSAVFEKAVHICLECIGVG